MRHGENHARLQALHTILIMKKPLILILLSRVGRTRWPQIFMSGPCCSCFNCSFNSGYVPVQLKIAKDFSFSKSGDRKLKVVSSENKGGLKIVLIHGCCSGQEKPGS